MFTMDSIHSVSEFSRKPAEYIKRLKETGKPEILTVNGKAEVVVQDARAYEEMMDLVQTLEKIAISAKEYENGMSSTAQQAFGLLDKKFQEIYSDEKV